MIDRYLRAVRSLVDSLQVSLDDALDMARVPADQRADVRAKYEEERALPIRRAVILSGQGGPRPWFQEWDPSTGYYWRRQRSYLIDGLGWTQADIGSLDDVTDRILSHLEDPRPQSPAPFDVRGLVMGYVQSGKTANYCALAAKAADVGYKLVIILSGIHNSLRLQTQRRINRALGLDPLFGVPEPDPGWRWIGLTSPSLNGDFNPGTIDANVLQGNEHVLIVCKKNATRLRRLIAWMADSAPSSLPVLVIDDEADQASINTGGNRAPLQEEVDLDADDVDDPQAADELDPSTINGLVRTLIGSFHRVSYIAYTATPFANILINHLAIDREVYDDLYPRDFIVDLPRPNGYTGAERLFGREALPGEQEGQQGLDVIEMIPDDEADLMTPTGADVTDYQPVISASMRSAFLDFVLATAARSHRVGEDIPSTMLIHTHHRKVIQNRLGELFQEFVAQIRQSWRYDKPFILPELTERWNARFRPVIASLNVNQDVAFADIESDIDRFFRDPVPVLVLNSDSHDVLDYDTDPTLKVVAVGGNRLSRGLTLEGLVVSFYVRRAESYDTLMQMGRWFGFHESYVDLTRIWTTAELAGWFRHLSLAEEELRREIQRYARENLTPRDFGPRIRNHPAMMITARNKMGSARVVEQNYSGKLLSTTSFRLNDSTWLQANLEAGVQLVSDLGNPIQGTGEPSQPVWRGVPWHTIDLFLSRYHCDPNGINEISAIRQYIQRQARQDELIEWVVSIRGRNTWDELLGVEPLLLVNGSPVNRIGRSRFENSPFSIGSLVNPTTIGKPGGDEEIGLTSEQLRAAREEAYQTGDFPIKLRSKRSIREGLLLLYPISPYSRPRLNETDRVPLFDNPAQGFTVLGIAIQFPASASAATIEYVVGSAGSFGGQP